MTPACTANKRNSNDYALFGSVCQPLDKAVSSFSDNFTPVTVQ